MRCAFDKYFQGMLNFTYPTSWHSDELPVCAFMPSLPTIHAPPECLAPVMECSKLACSKKLSKNWTRRLRPSTKTRFKVSIRLLLLSSIWLRCTKTNLKTKLDSIHLNTSFYSLFSYFLPRNTACCRPGTWMSFTSWFKNTTAITFRMRSTITRTSAVLGPNMNQ